MTNELSIDETHDLLQRHGRLLQSVCGDGIALQQTLRAHDAVIGGSTAVLYFYPHADFLPFNTDIFVPEDLCDSLLEFFTDQGYVVESDSVGPTFEPVPPATKSSISLYGAGTARIVHLHGDSKDINVYATTGAATEPLTYAWSTLLMSYVCADGACCPYPSLSTIGRGLFHNARILNTSFARRNEPLPINKYCEGRGFELGAHPTSWFKLPQGPTPCDRGWSCPLTPRHFGDGGCLNVCFTPAALDPFQSAWVFGGIDEVVHEQY
ncbi:hypothetical protein C8Q79DRAFT_1013055 [Trametes meyenii]|nr:hypothetical protein C8Q79DRAFT_1013055 [Trametes meyenii]